MNFTIDQWNHGYKIIILKCIEGINVYIDKLADIINEYKNIYHSTIKMKFVDVNSSTYVDFNKEYNKEDPKFEIDNHVRILK